MHDSSNHYMQIDSLTEEASERLVRELSVRSQAAAAEPAVEAIKLVIGKAKKVMGDMGKELTNFYEMKLEVLRHEEELKRRDQAMKLTEEHKKQLAVALDKASKGYEKQIEDMQKELEEARQGLGSLGDASAGGKRLSNAKGGGGPQYRGPSTDSSTQTTGLGATVGQTLLRQLARGTVATQTDDELLESHLAPLIARTVAEHESRLAESTTATAQAIQRLMADVEAREAAPKTLSPARGYRLIAPSDATVSERTSLSPPMTAGAGGRGTSTARGSPLGYRSISSEDMPLPSKTLGRVYPSSLSAGILASRTLAKLDATGQFSASTGELPSNSTTERTSTAASTGRLSFVGRASLAERAPSLSPKPLSPLGAALRSGRS